MVMYAYRCSKLVVCPCMQLCMKLYVYPHMCMHAHALKCICVCVCVCVHVMDVQLCTHAEENALVQKNPAPKVLFLTFGESSLDFELRVWVNDFIDRRQAQSELNQEIDRRFRSAKIEIPFPKIDLHVRGVEESPGSILTPLEDKRADLTVVSSEEKEEKD